MARRNVPNTWSGESVYNLIPPEVYVPPKAKQHKSTMGTHKKDFKKQVAISRGTAGPPKFGEHTKHTSVKASATMGAVRTPLRGQKNFLKKRENEPKLPRARKFDYKDGRGAGGGNTKPRVPKHTERPIKGEVTRKNFVAGNAVDAILMAPKRPKDETVDYRTKKDFGKVPSYLNRVKREVDEEYRYIAAMQEEQMPQDNDKMRLLSEDERQSILEGLKANWDRINRDYQKQSLSCDSIAKKAKKEAMEAQLEQIERDIEAMSKKFIFVTVND